MGGGQNEWMREKKNQWWENGKAEDGRKVSKG